MDISLDLYNYFYYVCEFKSVTKAANFLYVSQPAITKQIKKLENKLGKNLIVKTSNGIELTNDGRILYNEIKPAIEKLNIMENIFKEKSGKYNQTIRIIAGHSTIQKFLLDTLSKFNKIHPNIKFELSTYHYQESIQRLREGKADLIFFSMGEIVETYSNIVINKWIDVEDIFVVSKELKKIYPTKINLLELNNYPIICKVNCSVTRSRIEKYYRENGLEFIPTYELSNGWLIKEYVYRNIGIGLVTKDFVTEDLQSGRIIEIKTDIKLPKRETGYAYRKNSVNYSVLKEFINILNSSLKQ